MNSDFNKRTLFSFSKKYKSIILWFVILITFLIYSFRSSIKLLQSRKYTPESLVTNIGLDIDSSKGLLLILIIKSFFFFLPYIAITIFELAKSQSPLNLRFKDTSIGRMEVSEGYKNADLWYTIFFMFIGQFKFIAVILTLGLLSINNAIGTWFHELYKSWSPLPSSSLSASFIVLIAILISDLIDYFRHRIEHTVPFIWDLHELHHSPTQMTILSGDRGTEVDKVFTLPFTLPITTLTALLINEYIANGYVIPFILWMAYSFLTAFSAYLGHSSLKVVLPKPLSYILMSPSLHWLHHSSNPEHYNCNLGQIFPFWDQLFGTYKDETHLKDISSFGVPNTEYNKHHPLYSYSIIPILKLLRRFRILFRIKPLY